MSVSPRNKYYLVRVLACTSVAFIGLASIVLGYRTARFAYDHDAVINLYLGSMLVICGLIGLVNFAARSITWINLWCHNRIRFAAGVALYWAAVPLRSILGGGASAKW